MDQIRFRGILEADVIYFWKESQGIVFSYINNEFDSKFVGLPDFGTLEEFIEFYDYHDEKVLAFVREQLDG